MKEIIFFLLLFCSAALPQNFGGGFTFFLPADDTVSTGFLPRFPMHTIGGNEFVQIDGSGHFSVNGDRIRFWSTNSVADGAFPDKAKAWFVAGRLRKMGFNLIRFHHLDNNWTASLFESDRDTRQLLTHVNPYTKLALKDDPVMAMVEVTNENSIYRMWRDNSIRSRSDGGDFPARHVQMLDQQWHDYLQARYPDSDSLRSAWNR